MKDETVARFILRKKILDIIDDLKRDDKYGDDPSNVVEFAILQLYNESRDDVEKAEEDSIDQFNMTEQIKKHEAENAYFYSELDVEKLNQYGKRCSLHTGGHETGYRCRRALIHIWGPHVEGNHRYFVPNASKDKNK